MRGKCRVRKGANGEWWWTIQNRNGNVTDGSTEGYATRAGALKNLGKAAADLLAAGAAVMRAADTQRGELEVSF